MEDMILEFLEERDDDYIVSLWNIYCEQDYREDDRIYEMDEFNEILSSMNPIDIACRAYYGEDFNPSDKWFWFNAYGNLESFDYVSEYSNTPIYYDDLIQWIIENPDEVSDYLTINIEEHKIESEW